MEYKDYSYISRSPLSNLRLQQMLLVYEIARHGSLAAAAEATNMTQSAVTKNLQAVESVLGVSLFERSRAGLKSNLATARFLVACDRILTEVSRSETDIAALASGQQGLVRVGVLLAATPTLLPRVLLRMQSAYPRVGVEIVEGTLALLSPSLANGEIDLILGRLDVRAASDPSHQHVLYYDEVVLVVRNSHHLAGKRRLSLGKLREENWIYPPTGTSLREELDNAFRNSGVSPPDSKLASVALSTNLSLVEQLDCILALPKQVYLFHKKRFALKQLAVNLETVRTTVGYTLAHDEIPSPVASAFIQILKQEARSLSQTSR